MDINNPAVWGSQAWRKFHSKAIYYPENPTPQQRYEVKNFYEREFLKDIHCENCRTSYSQFLRQYPIRHASRLELFNWGVDIHNLVNKKLGKKQITYNEAYHIWFGASFINPDTDTIYTNPAAYQYVPPTPSNTVPNPPIISSVPAGNNMYVANSNATPYNNVYPVKYIPIQQYPYQQMAVPVVPTETIRKNIEQTKQMIHQKIPKRI